MYNSTFSFRPASSVQTNSKTKRPSTNLYESLATWCKTDTFTLTRVLKKAPFTQDTLFSLLLHTDNNSIAHFLKLLLVYYLSPYLMVVIKAQDM
jgi:hypothetical protein